MKHCYEDIEGLKVHYTLQGDDDAAGERPAILLMHGWGCSHETLQSIADVAAETHRVYNVDLPGFGQTPMPPEAWGVELYTQLIEKLVDRLGLQRPSLLGHSFGGRLAILYSSRRQVDKLILVDAAGVKPRRKPSYYWRVYSYKLSCRWLRLRYGAEEAERRIEAARQRRASADYLAAPPLMRRVLSRVVNEDLCHVMPQIKAPTLLIWGVNDTATPLADAKKMERLIPDAGLVEMERCGHYSFLDNPGQFQAVIRSFLRS